MVGERPMMKGQKKGTSGASEKFKVNVFRRFDYVIYMPCDTKNGVT